MTMKFGMLYGNHIRGLIRRRNGLSLFQGITYGLRAKGCYTETIYILLGGKKMVQKLLIIFTLPFLLFTGCSKEPTHSHAKDRDEIHQTLRLYEQMFVSENLDVLDEIFHPMAMLCWQSENPHTLSRKDCRKDLRETFGRRNYSSVKIYDAKFEITGNVAAIRCKEIHSFEDTDIVDKYIVYIALVKSQGCWRILTKVTTRQTNLLSVSNSSTEN